MTSDNGDSTATLDDLELQLLLEAIRRHHGYDFREYSGASLRRRVRHAMTSEKVNTISSLQDRVLHDPQAIDRFISALSVHVTAMFRDPEFYTVLRKHALPLLRTYPFIRIWHAGCATGEEVFSMAILLEEEGLYDRCQLYGTDLSESLLERARTGVFPISAMKENTLNYQRAGGKEDFSKYYVADHRGVVFRDSLRRNMVFSQHNLVSDGPFNEFHLILCRNVMIYFNQDLRRAVHQLLHQSLIRFGILGLGTKESLNFSPVSSSYDELVTDSRLYRRNR